MPLINRIESGYKISDRWHPRWGYCQVLVHESGAWWNLYKDFYFEGYVKTLNLHIRSGRFDPDLQRGLPCCNLDLW